MTVSDLSGSVFRLVVSTAAYRRTELCPQFCRRSRAWFIVERGEGRAVVSKVHECESSWKTPCSGSSSTRYRYKRSSEKSNRGNVPTNTSAFAAAIHSLRITGCEAKRMSLRPFLRFWLLFRDSARVRKRYNLNSTKTIENMSSFSSPKSTEIDRHLEHQT